MPNQSVQAEQALRGYEKTDSRTADLARVARMAQQAKKVLSHIAALPAAPAGGGSPRAAASQPRSVGDSARVATEKLERLQKSGVDLQRFYAQYDVQKTGRVSYKDFADTLTHLCAGVNRQDLLAVAAALDAQKAGSLAYGELLPALKAVRDSPRHQARPAYAKTTAPPTPPEAPATATDAVVELLPLERVLAPNLAAPYDYETAQQKSERLRASQPPLSFARDFHSAVPFHVDGRAAAAPAPSTSISGRPRRPHSAPPRAERSSFYRDHFRHDAPPPPSDAPVAESLRSVVAAERERDYAATLGLTPAEAEAAGLRSAFETRQRDRQRARGGAAALDPLDEAQQSPLLVAQAQATAVAATLAQQRAKTLLNRVVRETRGNVPVLARLLRRADASGSGAVSAEELRGALAAAGVRLAEDEHVALCRLLRGEAAADEPPRGAARPVSRSLASSSVRSVLRADAGVAIDRVVDLVAARATAAAFAHVTADERDVLARREAGRVARKVLEALQAHAQPLRLLRDTAASSATADGRVEDAPVSWRQLRDVLVYAQARVSPRDLQVLRRTLQLPDDDAAPTRWGDVEQRLAAAAADAADAAARATSVRAHAAAEAAAGRPVRYSATFASSATLSAVRSLGDLVDAGLVASRAARLSARPFAKLREALCAQPERVTAAFLDERLARQPLAARLRAAGVALAPQDAQRLAAHLQRSLDEAQALRDAHAATVGSVDDAGPAALAFFCDALAMPVRARADHFADADARRGLATRRRGPAALEAVDPRGGVACDDGVFAASARSLGASPTYATTLAVRPSAAERLRHPLLPSAKRAASASLGSVLARRAEDAATVADGSDAASFWRLPRSVDDALLFPTAPHSASSYPRVPPFLRPDGGASVGGASVGSGRRAQSVDALRVRRGVVSLATLQTAGGSSAASLASTVVPPHSRGAAPPAAATPSETPAGAFSRSAAPTTAAHPATQAAARGDTTRAAKAAASDSLALYYAQRDRVFGGAAAQSAAARDVGPRAERKGRFSRPASPGGASQSSAASTLSSPAASQASAASQSRGRRQLRRGEHAPPPRSDIFRSPDAATPLGGRRARSVPPFATYDA